MINFAVINLKGVLKNIIKVVIIFFLMIGIMNIGDLVIKNVKKFSYVNIIKKNISLEFKTKKDQNSFEKLILSEMPILASGNKNEIDNNINNEPSLQVSETPLPPSENIVQEQNTTSLRNLPTSIISENNLSENYNVTYGNVKIKNESKYTLTEDILTPNVEYTDKNNIVIFHTHTCESYTQTDNNRYTPSGNYRTTDLNYSVAKVGSVLTDALTNKGYKVNHSQAFHDYPAYNGSYNRSYTTVSEIVGSISGVQTVIDLHRDAIGSMSNYAPCVKIGDEKVAQLMFVIGTNGGGLGHDNWQTNLKYAVKIQQKANEMYPGLFRPIIVRNSRYNQNLTNSSFIIEVGATGNTLEEATGSMKYLAEVISEVMK